MSGSERELLDYSDSENHHSVMDVENDNVSLIDIMKSIKEHKAKIKYNIMGDRNDSLKREIGGNEKLMSVMEEVKKLKLDKYVEWKNNRNKDTTLRFGKPFGP